MVQQLGSGDGLPPDLVKKFNSCPDDPNVSIALTKKDIELLVNSLGELHQSYASLIQFPFIVSRVDREMEERMEGHANKSFSLFAELAENLMMRFIKAQSVR